MLVIIIIKDIIGVEINFFFYILSIFKAFLNCQIKKMQCHAKKNII